MTAMVRLTTQDLVVCPTKGSMLGQMDKMMVSQLQSGWDSLQRVEGLLLCLTLISYHMTNKK